MTKLNKVLICLIFFSLLLLGGMYFFLHSKRATTVQSAHRQVDQIALNPDTGSVKSISVTATKLPEFVYNLSNQKFDSIIGASSDQINNFVHATIVHTAYGDDKLTANVRVDKEKRELVVQPQDVYTFKPGLYKLSLTLRTLDGEVNIDQDFTWGVIAVNTNKSIYKPGEMAKIGIGVLNDKGETQCMTGLNRVDSVSMKITDPQGNQTSLSTLDGTIKDSGKCGPITVTNEADFQAAYRTTTSGTYQMSVSAVVRGEQREIEDYFKVDSHVAFDVERKSFPTRIYPPAPYPVTFSVTSARDYN